MKASLKNRIWITGKEIMDRWQITEYDFDTYLRKRYRNQNEYLQGYTPDLKSIAVFGDHSESEIRDSLNIEPAHTMTDQILADCQRKFRSAEIDLASQEFGLGKIVFSVEDMLEFEKEHGLVGERKRPVELANRMYMQGSEIMQRWNITESDFENHLVIGEIALGPPRLQPYVWGKPLDKGLTDSEWKEVPYRDMEFKVEELLEYEQEHGIVVAGDKTPETPDNLLDGQARRELGRLREEKKQWDKAIEAAVHAALLCQEKKIKRDELTDQLYSFGLPNTTQERIWKALRDKGLTKKAGRPPKTEK
jgi:hypothetical protein